MPSKHPEYNEALDLVLERVVPVSRELVWKAWTEPQHLKKWFVPAPWSITNCEIDLRPGGMFRTVMQSPEGESLDSAGCYLEIIEKEKLVFTDALTPGFRPSANPFFTAVITLEDHPDGTRYTALAMHKDEAGRKTHEDMGFLSGWSKCLDQLVALVQSM